MWVPRWCSWARPSATRRPWPTTGKNPAGPNQQRGPGSAAKNGKYDLIVMEGAGSCAEVNLMDHDIVNFSVAEYADAPVILVGDIHRGGIFAQLVGTLECLPPSLSTAGGRIHRQSLPGRSAAVRRRRCMDREKTGRPVFGVLPWYDHIRIDPEDSVVIERPCTVAPDRDGKPAVGRHPHPPHLQLQRFRPAGGTSTGCGFISWRPPRICPAFAAVILPGSKNTRFDLKWLKTSGWQRRLDAFTLPEAAMLPASAAAIR